MSTRIVQQTFGLHDEAMDSWRWVPPEFAWQPDDIGRYIDQGRWDLVYNALCFLTGVTEEGTA